MTIEKFDGTFINGDSNNINSKKDYEKYLDEIVDEVNESGEITQSLSERVEDLNSMVIDQEKKINDLVVENRSLKQNLSSSQSDVPIFNPLALAKVYAIPPPKINISTLLSNE